MSADLNNSEFHCISITVADQYQRIQNNRCRKYINENIFSKKLQQS